MEEYTREQELNTNLFYQNFQASPGHRGKIQDIPEKKIDFPGFEGRTELLDPHPFTWKTLPHRRISGLKSLGLCSFFVPDTHVFWQRQVTTKQLLCGEKALKTWPGLLPDLRAYQG